jgi:hypothetical protein
MQETGNTRKTDTLVSACVKYLSLFYNILTNRQKLERLPACCQALKGSDPCSP